MSEASADLAARARRVRLLLLDVDGVLTDATVVLAGGAGEYKTFSIRDGAALVWAREAGLEIGLLSGRPSEATSRRAAELGIATVLQGGPDKRVPFEALLTARGWTGEDVAYMGDDLPDLPVIARAGLSGAPADAAPEVLSRVHWTSTRPGGRGAVRDFVEFILRARGQWDAHVVARFLD
jgi:3-deoxy-D-manno-octulosonate 8-phosphate phosphatase (KDO 8-P phosphatase)